MLKKFLLVGIVTLLSVMASKSVQAQPFWTTNGGGCVPNDAAIRNNLYWVVTGGMRVKFQPGKTGTIKLICPVTAPETSGDANGFVVYYQDPDGVGGNQRVKAHLRSVQLSNGAYGTLCTVDSNNYFSTAQWSEMFCGGLAFDFSRFAYWIEVEIFRSLTTGGTVEFNAAKLAYIVE